MKKLRTTIPDKLAAEVEFESRRTCCYCRRPRREIQIHHLDGKPNNHARENLAVLCLECHSEASKSGGAGRSLKPKVIAMFRDEWIAIVEARRKAQIQVVLRGASGSRSLEDQVTALAIHDIRNLYRCTFSPADRWRTASDVIRALTGFVAGSTAERDPRVGFEVMLVLEHIASFGRDKMPESVAHAIASAAAWPLRGTALAEKGRFSRPEAECYVCAARVGHALAYEGQVHLANLRIVEHGALLLWRVLRDGVLGRSHRIVREALDQFAWLLSDERIKPPIDAGRILSHYREVATTSPSTRMPELPGDLIDKVFMRS